MLTFKTRSIAGTAAVVATLLTVAVAAPVRAETVNVPVSYADLKLDTQAGIDTLERRVDRAADRICGRSQTGNSIQVSRCRQAVLTSVKPDVDAVLARHAPVVLAAR